MVLKNTKKCTAKNNTENPDPDPDPGSGSASIYNVYGSETLIQKKISHHGYEGRYGIGQCSDPAFHFDADPDPTLRFDAEPYPTY